MNGYFGTTGDPESLFPNHWDRLHFSLTQGHLSKNERGSLAFEGHIWRFLNTSVPFQKNDPLGSFLELFEKHGESFVSHIDGMFLLLFAPKNEKMFLVNNRQQASRLYYAETKDGLFFSGSFKQLLLDSKISREPNFSSIRSFLANGFTISHETQLKNVHKLLPADYFVFHNSSWERKTYWPGDMRFDRRPFKNLEAHLDEYERLYRSGIQRFLEGKNPKSVGSLLSGGHDTSYLVAQASQVVRSPLHTYTVTFPGWKFDEAEYAKNVAEKFRTKHYPIPFGPEYLDKMLGLILANEEPVVGSSLPLHVLAEAAGKQVDTLLGGDGGDTLWAEYHPVAEYHRLTHRLPMFAKKALHGAAKAARNITDWERFWELEFVAELFTDPNYNEDFLRKLCTYRHFSDSVQNDVLAPELLRAPYARSHLEIPFHNKTFANALIEGKLYNGFFTYQAFHTAKIAQYFGMELFLPTIDKELMGFICSLPNEWVNGGTALHRLSNNKTHNRRFHKKALSRYFKREEIYNRSFDIPWYNILRPRKVLLERLLARLQARGWYQPAALNRIFQEFMTQHIKDHELLELKHHGYRIFTLLSLEIWCMEYLDGRFSSDDKNLVLEEYLAG